MFSTHIMQEAEAVCDRIIIINNGRIMADELKGNIYSIIKRQRQVVHVGFDKEPADADLLGIANVVNVQKLEKDLWLIEAEGEKDIRPDIFSFAVANDLTVLSLQKEESNLEEVFRHLTSR